MAAEAITAKGKITIAVRARPRFLPELSRESGADAAFVFAYTITIFNRGAIAARLVSRRWLITDGDNRTQEVRGAGVVGEQPRLAPGESFTYTSHVVLPTPVGTMRGVYRMEVEDGGGKARMETENDGGKPRMKAEDESRKARMEAEDDGGKPRMEAENGGGKLRIVEVEIPMFALRAPGATH